MEEARLGLLPRGPEAGAAAAAVGGGGGSARTSRESPPRERAKTTPRALSEGQVSDARNLELGPELLVHVVVMPNESKRQVSTRHDPAKYEGLYASIALAISEHFQGRLAVERVVDVDPSTAVLGSFELELMVNGTQRFEVFSKVRSSRFPTVDGVLTRLHLLLGVALRSGTQAQMLYVRAQQDHRDNSSGGGSSKNKPQLGSTNPWAKPARHQQLAEGRRVKSASRLRRSASRRSEGPVCRVYISVLSAQDGQRIAVQDKHAIAIAPRSGIAQLVCCDSGHVRLALESESRGPAGPFEGEPSVMEHFIQAPVASLVKFTAELGGWKQVSPPPDDMVFVDEHGPALVRIYLARVRSVRVQVLSSCGLPVGEGLFVRVCINRASARAPPPGLGRVEKMLLKTDPSGTVEFSEFVGSTVSITGRSNEDWIFDASVEVEVEDCAPGTRQPARAKSAAAAAAAAAAKQEMGDAWVYDSSDDDEDGGNNNNGNNNSRRSPLRPLVPAPVSPRRSASNEEPLLLTLRGATPRLRWCTAVFGDVASGDQCLCGSAEVGGGRARGFVVRIESDAAQEESKFDHTQEHEQGRVKNKAWCNCCVSGARVAGAEEPGIGTLGAQALARWASVQIRLSGAEGEVPRPAKVVRRTPTGHVICKLEDSDQTVSLLRQQVEPAPCALCHDDWNAVRSALTGYEMLGFPASHHQLSMPVEVPRAEDEAALRAMAGRGLVRAMMTEGRKQVGLARVIALEAGDLGVELGFPQGLLEDVPSGTWLELSAEDGVGPRMVRVRATCAKAGFCMAGFGGRRDGSHGSRLTYVAIARWAAFLRKKNIRMDPTRRSHDRARVSLASADMPGRGISRVSVTRAAFLGDVTNVLWAARAKLCEPGGDVVLLCEQDWLALLGSQPGQPSRWSREQAWLPASQWADLPAPPGTLRALLPVGRHFGATLQRASGVRLSCGEGFAVDPKAESCQVFLRSTGAGPGASEGGMGRAGAGATLQASDEVEFEAAQRIQARHRANSAQREFRKVREGSRLLQNWYRFRNHVLNQHRSASRIQAVYRGKQARTRVAANGAAAPDDSDEFYEDDDFEAASPQYPEPSTSPPRPAAGRKVHFRDPPQEEPSATADSTPSRAGTYDGEGDGNCDDSGDDYDDDYDDDDEEAAAAAFRDEPAGDEAAPPAEDPAILRNAKAEPAPTKKKDKKKKKRKKSDSKKDRKPKSKSKSSKSRTEEPPKARQADRQADRQAHDEGSDFDMSDDSELDRELDRARRDREARRKAAQQELKQARQGLASLSNAPRL